MVKYIFGPVPSRRLGVSLGVNLLPGKTCNLNCVYCECGKTVDLLVERKEYVPTKEVIEELDDYLKDDPYLDFVTFAGSGEPLLHSGISEIIDGIKERTDAKVALITNGTLFDDKAIFEEIKRVDVLVPSLDAISKDVFLKMNRPNSKLDLDKILAGMYSLRDNFDGEIYLEIFIIEGVNSTKEELDKFREAIVKIRADRVQLNTLDRPAVEGWVKPASMELLSSIVEYWGLPNVEIVKKYTSRNLIKNYKESSEEKLMTLIENRPCTIDDIKEVLGLSSVEINKYLDVLEKENLIKTTIGERGVFIQKR